MPKGLPINNTRKEEEEKMPTLTPSKWIWINGEFVFWGDANVHILSHALQYGSCVFEGIRCYHTKFGRSIFRLREHVNRLFDSAKIYHMEDLPHSQEQFCEVIAETVRKNDLRDCYIRPFIFRGYGELGVNPLRCPITMAVAVFPFVQYLGTESIEEGVEIMISSHRRWGFPAMAKAGGHYLSSQLIKVEAIKNGYAEGLALDEKGFVSECSGENIFLVRNGKLFTPAIGNSVLAGITRDTVIFIANEILGFEVKEISIPREMLLLSEEVFMTGTWAEITPVHSVSKQKIGAGGPGPVTKEIQGQYQKITQGEFRGFYPQTNGWHYLVKE